jgi:hypothetical protein
MAESSPTETLANWHYSTEEWRNFVGYEIKTQIKIGRKYRNWFWGIVAAALALMLAIFLFSYLVIGLRWSDEEVYGPVGAIAILTPIFLLIPGIFWLMQRHKINQFLLLTGEASIKLDGVRINGIWSGWVFEQNGWRFQTATRRTVSSPTGAEIKILEIRCAGYHEDNREDKQTIRKDRVPIPKGKEAEAEMVIKRLEMEKARFDNKENRQV